MNKQLVKSFLEEYPGIFTDFEKRCILNYTTSGFFMPAEVREVYDYLGLLPDDLNIYLKFLEILLSEFDIRNRRIIEVGGGMLPTLGRRIEANLDNGKLTVYDPRLSKYEKDSPKLQLVRKEFRKDTEIKDCDLLIGLMPEEAVEVLLDKAFAENKDFMVALGDGGPHGDFYDYYEDADEWRYGIIYEARDKVSRKNMGTLEIKYIKEKGEKYPVIYNKRG